MRRGFQALLVWLILFSLSGFTPAPQAGFTLHFFEFSVGLISACIPPNTLKKKLILGTEDN